ncbi:hypothetical protein JCM5350_007242 [Sporobolomyces pararoseus]
MATSTSTSTQSSSPISTGHCVICGQMSTLRCRECAQFGMEIFFCSEKHQKLVWFAHKRVCGKRSNPFRWPSFNAKEIEDMMELCDKPFQVDGRGPIRTFLSDTKPTINKFNGTPEEEKAFLKQSTRFIYQSYSGDNTSLPTAAFGFDQQVTLVGARSTAYEIRAFSTVLPPSERDARALLKRFFDMLANKERNLLSELSDNRGNYPFYSTWQHKYLFHSATIALCNVEDPPSPEIVAAVKHTANELDKFYREVVAKTHPKEARILLEGLIQC